MFIPHGQCFLWNQSLIRLHAVADAVIALSYFSIPLALIYFVEKCQDFHAGWLLLVFAGFILSCGVTHLAAIWNMWHADYWLSGVIKGATAVISLVTAVALWPLMPKMLTIPSRKRIQELNAELQSLNKNLELEISRRTVELNERSAAATSAAKLASIGQMAGGIAHEINTPLTIIQSRVRRIHAALAEHQDLVSEDLKVIEATVCRIANIIKGLRKITFGEEVDSYSSVSVSELIEETIHLCREKIKVLGVELVLDSASYDNLYVTCNPTQISEVLLNLLNNACDAVQWLIGAKIEVFAVFRNMQVEIHVKDNGPGIKPELTPKKNLNLFYDQGYRSWYRYWSQYFEKYYVEKWRFFTT